MRRLLRLRLVSVLLILAANVAAMNTAQAACRCDDLHVDLSTGISTTGATLPVGSADLHWKLDSGPAGANVGPAQVIQKHGVWTPTALTSNWINAATAAQNGSTPGGDRNTPGGIYTYSTTFNVNTVGQSNIVLDIAYSADDGVEFYLNQVNPANKLGGDPFVLGSPSWSRESHINYSGALIQNGPNTLYAVVENWILWTGFYVRGAVTGICDVERVRVPIRTGATGTDQAGPLMAQGTVDDDWTITSMPHSPSSGSAFAIIPNSTLAAAWTAVPTSSRWISRVNSQGPTGNQGDFVYEDTVPLRCAHQPICVSALINLRFAADDAVSFDFSGIPIGNAAAPAFGAVNALSANVPCEPGGGVLRATVDNDGAFTGLWVEGDVIYTVV